MIKKYYLMKSIHSLSISLFSGFIFIYISNKGISYAQLGMLTFLFWTSSLIFEIPSGIISDFIGRKKVYILSSILRGLGLLIIAFSNNYIFIALGFVVTGIADAFSSGCLEAWIFDVSRKDQVDKISIMSGKINTLLSALAGVIGVKLFYNINGTFVLSLSCFFLILNSFIAFLFINDLNVKIEKNISIRKTLLKMFTEVNTVFSADNKKITFTTLLAIIAITLSVIPGSYYQLLFADFESLSIVLSVLSFSIPLTAFIGQTLYKKFNLQKNNKLLDLFLLLSALAIVGSVFLSSTYFAIGLFLFHVFLTAIIEIFILAFINKNIESNRNTIISVVFFIQSLFSSLLLFIASILVKYSSVNTMQVIVTIVLVASYLLVYLLKRITLLKSAS